MKDYENFDFENLVRLVLKEIRGNRTQKEMSERLQYTYNQWHKWESGQKKLMWSDLEKIASVLQINLETAKQTVSLKKNIGDDGREFVLNILKAHGGPNTKFAKEKLKLSPAAYHRLKSSKKDVEVAFVFRCLGILSSMLPYFLDELVRGISGKVFQGAVEVLGRQVQLESAFPWLSSLEACIELDAYKQLSEHNDLFIAEILGLSEKQVRAGLKMLVENETILREGEKYVLNIKRVDLQSNIEESAKFAKFWSEISLRRFQTADGVPSSRKGFANRVTPVSAEAMQKIHELRFKFYEEMNKVFQSDGDRPKEHILVFNMHVFDNDELKELKILG